MNDEKPYYLCKHVLRCRGCNKHWPDKCECPMDEPIERKLARESGRKAGERFGRNLKKLFTKH